MDATATEPRRTVAHEINEEPGQGARRGTGIDHVPAALSAQAAEPLRPETLRLLQEIAATPAVLECPVPLTREEVLAVLDLIDARAATIRSWARTLEWGLRYAQIAQRLVTRSALAGYSDWIERHRMEPMRTMHAELTGRAALPAERADGPLAQAV
jgi:hypothetical protein